MRRFVLLLGMLGMLFLGAGAMMAAPPEFLGGVNNEYEYEEVIFLTGAPIKFTGTVAVTERDRANGKVITYRFKLAPEDPEIKGKVDRTVTYTTNYTKRTDKGQTIGQTEVTSYKDTVEIGSDKYVLEDYQFSKSDIIDNRPASDFYSGNLQGRKYYSINKNKGKVIVEMSGGNVGYHNFWGSTETQVIDYVIDTEREVLVKGEEGEADYTVQVSWQGRVRVQASDSMTKNLRYSDNETHFSSFEGGHMRITNSEMVSRYDYNLPRMTDGLPHPSSRERGSIQLSKQMAPKIERLIVPKFRDIGGHWAEDNIRRLYSLDVFDDVADFFLPDIPMTRVEFTKGIMRASNIRLAAEQSAASGTSSVAARGTRGQVVQESPFVDVESQNQDFKYIKEAVDRGIIKGVSPDEFKPNDPLTRAQAITIIIRVLGFEGRAPSPGYRTSFTDDARIPSWAKDSIYVAREIGLVHGDNFGNINPNKVMTRAEASAMLTRFLEFLERDLQRDYRENIMLFQ
ncbi:MAG: S-layer homology domain-containing protein [Bacillota bacterium]